MHKQLVSIVFFLCVILQDHLMFPRMLMKLVSLRTLSSVHSEQVFALRLQDKKLPPLLSEIWDVNEWLLYPRELTSCSNPITHFALTRSCPSLSKALKWCWRLWACSFFADETVWKVKWHGPDDVLVFDLGQQKHLNRDEETTQLIFPVAFFFLALFPGCLVQPL